MDKAQNVCRVETKQKKKEQKSETRMTASNLKQDPNA